MAIGVLCGGELSWRAAKAQVARHLIGQAFERHLDDGQEHRPWSWADHHPLARLRVPQLGIEQIVLSGADGSSLAFGPGHVSATAPPNGEGNCVIAGHRDSWFSWLRDLAAGDELELVTRAGVRRYAVVSSSVVHQTDLRPLDETPGPRLTLITCYPFDGIVGSPWRYIVELAPGRSLTEVR